MTHLFDFAHSHCRRLSAALLAALVAAGCGGAAGAPDGGGPPGGAMPPMPVEMVTIAAKPVDEVGDFVGIVKSRRSTTIQPQAEGFITRILVSSGARVSPGTALFEIDATPQQAAVATLEQLRAAREADATFARQQAERTKTLLGVGAASQQEYDQAVAQQKAAEAQLLAVVEQIRQQRAELAYYRVSAPTSGVVGDIPVREGDRVGKGTVLTTIDDNTGLEVYVSVPVREAAKLRAGLPVRIVGESGRVIASTRANFVSPSVDDATQTVLVKAPVAPGDGSFRTDQFVRVQVVFSNAPAVTIPVVSVSRISGQQFAFVAEPGEGGGLVARQRPLVLGPVVGDSYVVLGGLKAGDRLILAGTQKIGDGAPVQPMPAGPPTGGKGPGEAGRGAGK
jgi:RND family efflux transporter MFP subunit